MRVYSVLLLTCLIYLTACHSPTQSEHIQLFSGQTRAVGTQLWQTDNSSAGTQVNEYVLPNPTGDSAPQPLGAIGKLALFSAFTPEAGRELWRTDGTSQGTQLVKDLWQGAENGLAENTKSVVLNERLWFWSHHPQELRLMQTDGSAQGTHLIASFPVKSAQSINVSEPELILFAQQVYFWVDDGQHGLELWRSNGKTAELVVDTTQEQQDAYAYAPNLIKTPQALYFISPQQREVGTHKSRKTVWQISANRTKPLYELTAEEYSTLLAADEQQLVLLRQADFQKAYELWTLNLSTQQAQKIQTLPDSSNSYPIGKAYWFKGQLHWWMERQDQNNTEWWRSDLSTTGTYRLLQVDYPNAEYKTSPECFSFSQRFYCFSKDGVRPAQLWLSDGSVKGTRKLLQAKDGQYAGDTGGWSDTPSSYVEVNQHLVFATFANKGRDYSQLWSLASTAPEKPQLLGEFADPLLLRPAAHSQANSLQFISAKQRWQTDGTAAGTRALGAEPTRINWQPEPWSFMAEQQVLAFQTPAVQWLLSDADAKAGVEPWLLSPQPPFSYLLKDINQAPANSKLTAVNAVGAAWYFIVGKQLWFKSDVNVAAQVVTGIPEDEIVEQYNLHPVVVADDAFYFMTQKAQRYSIWRAQAGKAERLSTYPEGFTWLFPAQHGFYVTHKLAQGYRVQHWQHQQLTMDIRETGQDSKDFISLLDTPQGLVLLFNPPYNPQQSQILAELWWQPSPTTAPQLISDQFQLSNLPSQTLQQTAAHVYALQEQPFNDEAQTYQLSRLDFAQKRLVPLTNLPTLGTQSAIKAARHGLYLLSYDKAPCLWYLADGQSQAVLLKQFSPQQAVELAQVQGNTLYLNVSSLYDDFLINGAKAHGSLWISRGTASSTRLLKANVWMDVVL
jgi:ELWxxDGT repeat protein